MDLTNRVYSLSDLLRITPPNTYWYLATPYSKYEGGLRAAFVDASAIAARFIEASIPVFCPIAHSHPIAMHGMLNALDHGIWLPADAPLMHHAHGLIVCDLPGWEDSYGIKAEIEAFRLASKPIHFLTTATMELSPYVDPR